ncbi:uncharacterized protein LOC129787192 [Lutzomyia longipalpis]|uniref:uncharacterized protein LOC129787192 n=1 Tax=Lutzomyia longipalpis TaxID=7200 RepID=UPI00248343A5|nr:uncharacterized protein LOC129787192 [Lutzomyia longipalpis]
MAAASSGNGSPTANRFGPLDTGQEDFPLLSAKGKRKRMTKTLELDRVFYESNNKRFLVAESENEGDFLGISYFKVKRSLDKAAGKIPFFQPLANGKLLIQASNEDQAKKLMAVKEIDGKTVKFSMHQTLNQSKGIIACFAFTKLSDEELKTELAAFNVTEVKRIKRKVTEDGTSLLKDTGSFILTFNQPTLPKELNAYYHALRVRPYIPNPMRCQKCQKYGHHEKKCRAKEAICGICSLPKHDGQCNGPAKCANCGEEHVSWNRKCRIFREEFDIQRIRVTEKISYVAAKKVHKERKRTDTSYAEALRGRRAEQAPTMTNRQQPNAYQRRTLPSGERMESESAGNLNSGERGLVFRFQANKENVDIAKAERNSPFSRTTEEQHPTTESITTHTATPHQSTPGAHAPAVDFGVPSGNAGTDSGDLGSTGKLITQSSSILYNPDEMELN